jgi:phage FluMu protein Com
MPEYEYSPTKQAFIKHCPKCKTDYEGGATQELAENNLSKYFSNDRYTRDGFTGQCKNCVSKYMRAKRGGRDCNPEQILAEQGGKCALCPRCNTMLSQVEREGWVEKALAYIQKYKCE